MSRSARVRDENQRGQALPMAAIGIFAVCLGVLATLNLGQAVHQKIKLQNTADSAAYTLAAMEARTFNYIAFLNRAQIAHYNTAMVVQSYITWVGFQVAMFGAATDLMSSLRNAFQLGLSWPCKGPGCPFHSAGHLYGLLTAFASTAEATRLLARNLYRRGATIGHQIVEAMAIFNARAIWQSQFARAGLINAHLLTGMQSYVKKLDPDIGFKKGKSKLLNSLVNSALNSIEYYQAFDKAAGLNPFIFSAMRDWPKLAANDYMIRPKATKTALASQVTSKLGSTAKAALAKTSRPGAAATAASIMAELSNASRSPAFVSARNFPNASQAGFVSIRGLKFGSTRFTAKSKMLGAWIKGMRREKGYPVGKFLASDDFIVLGHGRGVAGPASVTWSGVQPLGDAIAASRSSASATAAGAAGVKTPGNSGGGGKHYRYRGPDSTTGVAIFPSKRDALFTFAGPLPPKHKTFETKSGNHAPWPGFAAYFKFNASGDRTRDFNQPSTWIFLNKHHKDFSRGQASDQVTPWYSKFSWTQGGSTGSLDTTIGGKRNSYLFEGVNAASRAMVYYHRPGAWPEAPNFFNPFWRARLAPIGNKLQNFWQRYVSSRFSTRSKNVALRAAVNVLRNAQMDYFTAALTSVATH